MMPDTSTSTSTTYVLWSTADLNTVELPVLAFWFERMRKAAWLAERAGLKVDTNFDGNSYDVGVTADDLPALLTLASQLDKGYELTIDAYNDAGALDGAMSVGDWRDHLGLAR